MVAPLLDVGNDYLQALVDDAVDAVIDDEEPQVEVGAVRQRAAIEAPTTVAGEDEGMQAWVGELRTDAQPEAAAHGGAVVRGVERNRRMWPLGDVLAVLVGDADVVEADAVRPPRLVELLVERQ